jgi:hypothetical protein
MRLAVVHGNDLRFGIAIRPDGFRRKNHPQRAQRKNAEEQRGFDRSRHWGSKPYQSSQELVLCSYLCSLIDLLSTRARARLRRGRSGGQSPEVLKRVEAGIVAVGPARLQGVATDQLPAHEFETGRRVTHIRPRNIPQHVGLAATQRARASATKAFQRQVRFQLVVPTHGQLAANQLNVRELKSHLVNLVANRKFARDDFSSI